MNHEQKLLNKAGIWIYNPLIGNFIGWVVAISFIASTHYINNEAGWTDNKWPIIVGIIIGTLITTRLHSIQEAIKIEIRNIKPKTHFWRGVIVILISILIGCIIHFLGDSINIKSFLDSLFCAEFISSTYYLCFDYFLNYDRGKKLKYITKDEKGSISDRIFGKLSDNVEAYIMLGFKLLLFTSTAIAYIVRLNQLK